MNEISPATISRITKKTRAPASPVALEGDASGQAYLVDTAAVRILADQLVAVAGDMAGDFCFASIPDTGGIQHHTVPNGPDAPDQIVSLIGRIGGEPHNNIYFSAAIFKPDAIVGNKGRTEKNVIGVLGGVADFDGKHDPATRHARSPLAPTGEVESSAGNFQCQFFFDRPYAPNEAKPVLEVLATSVAADQCKSVEHLYRVPGTYNWPDAGKIKAGRSPIPFATRWTAEPESWNATSPDDLRAAIGAKYPHAFDKKPDATNAPSVASDKPVMPELVEAMLSHIDPADRNNWLVVGLGLNNAPLTGPDPEKKRFELFDGWASGKYDGGIAPDGYKGTDDCAKLWQDDCEKHNGENYFGALVNLARAGGYDERHFSLPPAAEIFKGFIGKQSEVAQPFLNDDQYGWGFDTFNAAEDVNLPPIIYRDENKLWPIIPGGSLTQIIAQAKGYKTTFYLSELFRLVTKELKAGDERMKVLVVAAEGAYGLRKKRIPALCQLHGITPEQIAGRFDVLKVTKGGAIDFSNETCVRSLAAFARSRGYTHIVIDTQNRVSFGLEENSAKDMGLLVTHLELLKELSGADIISIHHKGADPKSDRGRGSSVQEASFDQVIEVRRDRVAQTVMVEVKFRKDGPDGFQVPFRQIGGRGDEDAPPILQPMTWTEYKSAEAASDTLSARNVSAALVQLKARGRANAVTSRVVAHKIHESRGTLPANPEDHDKFLKGQVNRLSERTGWERYSGMCDRDGAGKTAPWVWFLPDVEGVDP